MRALAKLEQVLPSRLRNRVQSLHSIMVPLHSGGPTVDPNTLIAIANACRDHERLRFDYRNHDGDDSLRAVEPHRLVHTGRRWYLVAFDIDRDDWRTFRVDRLTPRIPTGPKFVPRDPPDEDLAAYTAYGLSNGAYRYRAVVTLHMSAEAAAEYISPSFGVLEPIDDTSCTLRVGAHFLDGVATWISTIGCEFQVHEPPELINRLRDIAARVARAADRSE